MKREGVSDVRSAIGYVRGGDEAALARDERVLRDYAAANGLVVGVVFADGGLMSDRGEGFRAMVRCLAGVGTEAPHILVRNRPALYRRTRDVVTVENLNTSVHFVDEGIVIGPHSTASEKWVEWMLVALGEYEARASAHGREG